MSEPKPRYPVLAKAIERGRLAEAGVPDPRNRKLRCSEEQRILTNPDVQAAVEQSIPAIEAFEEAL